MARIVKRAVSRAGKTVRGVAAGAKRGVRAITGRARRKRLEQRLDQAHGELSSYYMGVHELKKEIYGDMLISIQAWQKLAKATLAMQPGRVNKIIGKYPEFSVGIHDIPYITPEILEKMERELAKLIKRDERAKKKAAKRAGR